MVKKQRIEELKKIKLDENNIIKSGITLKIEGDFKTFDTYKIPLECLIYNKYNGRIAAEVRSYEKQFPPELNPEIEEDKKKVEEFLWDSQISRNNFTMDSLINDRQIEYGCVTNDGIIINGNRRAMLLSKIYRDRERYIKDKRNVDHCKYFEAIILDKEYSPAEIMKLETIMQMGKDNPVDFDAIQKYLRIQDLKNSGNEDAEIAYMMGVTTADVKKFSETLVLMENYLRYWHYDNMYTMLKKREDLFLRLGEKLKDAKKHTLRADWNYEELDISELERCAYDLIRAEYEGKDFRTVLKLFSVENAWKKFIKRHKEIMGSVAEEPVESIRENNPSIDLSEKLEFRNNDFKEKTASSFENNTYSSDAVKRGVVEYEKPLELLNKCLKLLEGVDRDNDGFYNTPGILEKIIEINKKSFELKKLLD